MARQAVHGAIVALEASATEHVYLTTSGVKAAQALRRQQVTAHVVVLHPFMPADMAVVVGMAAAPVGVTLVAMPVRAAVDFAMFRMDLLVVFLVLVVDDGADDSEAQNGRSDTGRAAVVFSIGWYSGKGRERENSSCQRADKAGGKKGRHERNPCLKGSGTRSVQRICSIWGAPRQTGNNGALLSDNARRMVRRILYISGQTRMFAGMKHLCLILSAALILGLSGPADAANCYADYKAKQDNPLRLHYGVAEIRGACTVSSARAQLTQRLGARGWTLLNVVSVFGPEGLNRRKNSAGSNFLRF